MARYEFSRKPRKCPACGSVRIARIAYGMVAPDAEMLKEMEEGRVVLGGCVITNHDPQWQCADCGVQFYKRRKS